MADGTKNHKVACNELGKCLLLVYVTAKEQMKSWQLYTLIGVLCTSHFHLFVELDIGIVEQLEYLVHILANWIVELAPSAVKVLMERMWVMNGDSTQQRGKAKKQ